MHCNFRITRHVALNGAFGALDVHDVYRLDRCEADDAAGALRLSFRAGFVLRRGRPQTFRIDFFGLDLLEMHAVPAELSALHIDEAGFMAADDRDYRWLLWDGEPGAGKHLVFKGREGEVIRVSAERAELTLTDLPARAAGGAPIVTRLLAGTWAVAVLLTAGAAAGAWNERVQAPMPMDFCEVASNPKIYDGRAVILRGRLDGGPPHGYGVADIDCPAGFFLDYVGDDTDPQWRRLIEGRNREYTSPDAEIYDVDATFVGRVRDDPDGRRLEVSRVGQVEVRRAPPPLTADQVDFAVAPVWPVHGPDAVKVTLICEVHSDGALDFCMPNVPFLPGTTDEPDDTRWDEASHALRRARLARFTHDGSPVGGREFAVAVPAERAPAQP